MAALQLCPTWAPALGFGGAAVALSCCCLGSAYGTGKAGMGVSSIGVHHPELVMKSMIPVIMAGVLGIYGLIIAVIIGNDVKPIVLSTGLGYSDYSLFTGFAHLSAGICCGMSGLAAGITIGIVGDAGVRANALKPKVYVGMVLMLIFAEALGLYGLIVGLILTSQHSNACIIESYLEDSTPSPPPLSPLAYAPPPSWPTPHLMLNTAPSSPPSHPVSPPPIPFSPLWPHPPSLPPTLPPISFLGSTVSTTPVVALILGILALICFWVKCCRPPESFDAREMQRAPIVANFEMYDRRELVQDKAWDEAKKLIVDHLADRNSTDEDSSLGSPH